MEQTNHENTTSDAPINHDEQDTGSPFEQEIPARDDQHVTDTSQVDVEDQLRSYHFEQSAHLHDVAQHVQDQSSIGGHNSLDYSQPDYNAMAAALDASRPPSSATTAAAAAAAAAAATQRTKISKACDKCREKKVRCDGVTDTSTGSCTPCKRAEVKCTFSRQQMKRGPSRGYIRKLTETVERLERQRTGKHAEELALSSVTEDTSPIPALDFSNFHNAEARHTSFGSHNDSNGHGQQGLKRSAEHNLDPALRSGLAPAARGFTSVAERPIYVDLYFQEIHPYLPFLHPEALELHQRKSPGDPLSAFTEALQSCLMTFASRKTTTASADEVVTSLRSAHESYTRLKYSDSMTWSSKAQFALMLLVTSVSQGHPADRKLPVAPLNLMEEARSVIESAKTLDTFSSHASEGRRLNLCAGLLDVLMGCAYSDYKLGLHLSKEDLNARPDDLTRFGKRFSGLTRLSQVLRKTKSFVLQDGYDGSNANGAGTSHSVLDSSNVFILGIVKDLVLDTLQEVQLTSHYQSDPILKLAFWYTRLIVELQFYPLATSDNLLFGLSRVIEGLSSLPELNLLAHHFTGLAAHLLVQLIGFEDTKHEASALLGSLYNVSSRLLSKEDGRATSSLDAMVFASVHRNVIRERPDAYHEESSHTFDTNDEHETIHETSTLEHLANAAVGTSADDEHETEMTLDGIAEAAAAAAKAALSGHRNGHAHQQMETDNQLILETFSGEKLSREGYLTALTNME